MRASEAEGSVLDASHHRGEGQRGPNDHRAQDGTTPGADHRDGMEEHRVSYSSRRCSHRADQRPSRFAIGDITATQRQLSTSGTAKLQSFVSNYIHCV